jgi:hypothetical protein
MNTVMWIRGRKERKRNDNRCECSMRERRQRYTRNRGNKK